MSIVSRKVKNGHGYAQYGCSARHHKGAAVCANGQTIGEARLMEAVLGSLREYFASPNYEAWLDEAYAANQRARARAASREDERARLEAAVNVAESRIEKVTEAFARIGYSEPLAAKLRAEEARLLEARTALAAAAPPKQPERLRAYSGAAVLCVVENIAVAAMKKPQEAKALLRGVVEAIVMHPSAEGYRASITLKNINPANLLDGGVDDSQRSCGARI